MPLPWLPSSHWKLEVLAYQSMSLLVHIFISQDNVTPLMLPNTINVNE